MRRTIAHRLTVAKQTVPHYTLTSDITLDALLALRARLNGGLKPEVRLSVNDFLVKAAALSLRRVPEMNSSWLDHAIRAYDYVDVAVAVAVPDGLVTPVVKDADTKGLSAISRYASLFTFVLFLFFALPSPTPHFPTAGVHAARSRRWQRRPRRAS